MNEALTQCTLRAQTHTHLSHDDMEERMEKTKQKQKQK